MGYLETLKASARALVFDEKALSKISNDEKASLYGVLTLLLAGIGYTIYTFNPRSIFFESVALLVSVSISVAIFHVIAKYILSGQASFVQYFRALSNLFIVSWVAVLPAIGSYLDYVAGFWLLVMNIFILNKIHKLSTAKSIILGLLPIILILIIAALAVTYFATLSPSDFLI